MPFRLLFCSHIGAPVERQTEPISRAGLLLFFASIIRRWGVLAAAVVLGATASRAETAALPVTEIASGIFVHNGVHEEASAANADAIANVDPAILPNLPTAPDNMKTAFLTDPIFWGDKGEELRQRFTAWLAQ